MKLYFVTGNQGKFEAGLHAFKDSDIELVQVKLETPEIQSLDGAAIAEFSAQWACEKLNAPVIKNDASWHFDGLNGFPGPFAKYAQAWFGVEEIMELLKGKSRDVHVTQYLCLARPNQAPITFSSKTSGTAALTPSTGGRLPFDRLFIPNGQTKTLADLSIEERNAYWATQETFWGELKKYLKSTLEEKS